ncbi:FdhF/YdeP family oxidoreductase [Neptuniibacter caesariensis]|uniref:Molybdopterin oxidoreductase, alpha subunit, putative n=1 Tax=Neptuniibacter caesariensis TaxID=207954 RepID=A0A7U8C3Q5_NEPCE|nr:FdhF/YdeP family oxidoreductase [Neptuniibacter caesariensis]EAR60211.1 molybdopterin oxidoreductase, alpha subunit, putative [Oceanospirillum sp. MED92] [Neptuniibacter caesariensis]
MKKQKSSNSDRAEIQKPSDDKPAGGWGALQSTTTHLLQSKNAAKNIKTLLNTNQHDGFDCPGCAWGEEKNPSRIRFCENGAKAVNWEATSKKVDRTFFAKYQVSWLKQQTNYYLEYQGRLCEPMRYDADSDKYLPITWDQAYNLIADHLHNLQHPDQLELYTSGRASNEAAYLYQLFGRMFGTNNFPDCSNMCHEASGVALSSSIGIGKGTVTLEDFEHADAIFVFGQNPGTNHPRMLDTLRGAIKRGASVVIFNTLKERGLEKFQHPQDPIEMLSNSSTTMNSLYFTPHLGGDMAIIRGMVKALLERSDFTPDSGFLSEHATGVADYLNTVKETDWSQICEQSGLEQSEIETAAEVYAKSNRVISTWAMGLTQHFHSVATLHELVNWMALNGNIGKKGAGLCPVRGHSNVQGDRTMGINERPSADFLDSLEERFDFDAPRNHGHSTVEAIEAMRSGESKVFIGLGGNFAAATPDTPVTESALANCDLTVHISTKLNRSHLITGKDALILPCLGRTDIDLQQSGEQKVTVEDSFSMVHASKGILEPLSKEMRSEPDIICGIAAASLGEAKVPWTRLAEDYSLVRDLIEDTVSGFNNFNRKIDQPGGFYLGNSARERIWKTASEKLAFHTHQLPTEIIPFLPGSKRSKTTLILQTMRSHDQYNTTIYGMNDRYRGIKNERKVVFINPEDITRLGYEADQRVSLRALWHDEKVREIHGFRLVPYDIPIGNIAAYYPETNPLIPLDSYGEQSRTPTSKSIAVELFPYQSNKIV